MQSSSTEIPDVMVLKTEKKFDERGYFERFFCTETIPLSILHVNFSYSEKRGTLRGLHYQLPPFEEIKVVRCLRGSLFDVVVDLRPTSPTFGKYFSTILTAEGGETVVVPKGCAHGIFTLTDSCELLYLVSEKYAKEQERTVRYDDPTLAIAWPGIPTIVSEKDALAPFWIGNR